MAEEGGDEVIVGDHDVFFIIVSLDTSSTAATSAHVIVTTVRAIDRSGSMLLRGRSF